ncbi:MAG TPA: prolyl oligopeptidase family serine peptidase [Roseivirga sp.]
MHKLIHQEILIEDKAYHKPLTADITYFQNHEPKAIIIFAHGFKGFKEWGPWPNLANQVAVEGFCFCKLNFSYNGTTPEILDDITDLEAFGHNNFSKELEDLDRLIDFLLIPNREFSKEIDPNRLFLIGHSRGGGISIIKAAEDPRIKKVATWASVHDFASRFSEAELAYWKAEGVVYAKNSRTGANYPMYYQFVEDFINNGDRFIISNAVKRLNQPMLIIHGTKDETVNVQSAFQLQQWNAQATLFLLEDANHTFGGKHPFNEDELPSDLKKALLKTISFFKTE